MNKERTPTLDQLDERACAFQQSLVFMRQDYPNMAVMAYDNEVHQYANHLLLAKFVIGLDGEYMELEKCVQGSADNITGGLKGHCLFNGEQVRAEIYPLMLDREQFAWEGGAVIFIETDSSKQLSLRFGNGDMAFMHLSPNAAMSGSEIDCQHGECRLEGDFVLIRREERTLRTAVKGGMDFEICSKLSGGSYAEGKTNAKKTALMVGFSPDEKRAKEIASLDPEKERKKIQDYYQEKLKDWYIRTPDPQLDEAFQHALLNHGIFLCGSLGMGGEFPSLAYLLACGGCSPRGQRRKRPEGEKVF